MSKSKIEETKSTPTSQTHGSTDTPKSVKRTKLYTFPDFDGGPAVMIEATSLQEATETYLKGQATA